MQPLENWFIALIKLHTQDILQGVTQKREM